MSVARRFLPSLSILAAFEAAARYGSVTAAAAELDLTQSAVSRQIRALEEQLGVELFVRERQTIRLTSAGAAYAVEIRDALQRISSASLNLRANPMGGTLNLAIPPTFGTRWLAPRLPEFLAACPGVTLNLTTRLTRFDFRFEPIDAAIYVGDELWPGSESVLLCNEEVVPACSPDLRDRLGFQNAADLKKAGLIHIATRPRAWERWMLAHGADASGTEGMVFDQFATLAQAAIAGLGIALVPTFLVSDEFESGRLVRALDKPMRSAEAYYLVWPTHVPERPPLMAFRRWILEAIARDGPGRA